MGKIKIEYIGAASKINGIKSAGNKIETSVSSINSPSKCSGIMISKYRTDIQKISKLLINYKKLVERDSKDMIKECQTMVKLDEAIMKQLIAVLGDSSGSSAHQGSGHGGGGGGGGGW